MKMIKQKWIITILVLLLIIFVIDKASCINNRNTGGEQDSIKISKYNSLAIDLNNKATGLWQKEVLKNKPNNYVVIQVTKLLDSAITLDSSYYLAYTNKVNILCSYGHKLEAIAIMEKCVRIVPSFAEGIDLLGMLYESLGRNKVALKYYEKALSIYEKRFKEKHGFNDRCNGIMELVKIGRKEEADSLVGELPHDFQDKKKEIASFLDIYTTYNHNEVINNICKRQYK